MAKKQSDAEQVAEYMAALEHPMKAEIEALRDLIKGSNPNISERIKWNAPSYHYQEDLVTFGPPSRKTTEILLVFHHPSIVNIKSELLTGDYKDRRLATFKNIDEVENNREEVVRILNLLVSDIEAFTPK